MSVAASPDEAFGLALDGGSWHLALDCGSEVPVPFERFTGDATPADARLLARTRGPVLDIGCGPGRHVHHLARRGVLAIGIDISAEAIRLARRRGAPVLLGSVFDDVPGAGAWGTALLLDGNIGIGGDPQRLLRRAGTLLAPGAELLVECTVGPEIAPRGARATRRARRRQPAVRVGDRRGGAAGGDRHGGRARGGRPLDRRGARVRGADGEGDVRLLPAQPPPGPARPGFWRSPLRGKWLTTALGSLLFPAVLLIGLTGFLSHAAYAPDLGQNAIVPVGRDLDLFVFDWPTSPSWLYAATQGFHVTVGITVIPLLLAKLWSVIPKLFAWPPIRSVSHAIERLSLLGLVAGALFEFATGVLNVQIYYPFHFNFVVAHYYGAWVFLLALLLHVGVKLPIMRSAYRERGALAPLRASLAQTEPEPYEPGGLASPNPDPPSLSRRGLFGLVGAASAALFVTTVGQSIGGPLRRLALLAPHGGRGGGGPNGFQVNKSAATAGVTEASVRDWLLQVGGPRPAVLTRERLLAMDLATHDLPIACVEGWSTTQRWTGVRLRDLAALAGAPDARAVQVVSLQPRGVLRQATLGAAQIADERSLLALRVNGADLSMDHGFPARIIVPGLPGVHNTKWVSSLEFES